MEFEEGGAEREAVVVGGGVGDNVGAMDGGGESVGYQSGFIRSLSRAYYIEEFMILI